MLGWLLLKGFHSLADNVTILVSQLLCPRHSFPARPSPACVWQSWHKNQKQLQNVLWLFQVQTNIYLRVYFPPCSFSLASSRAVSVLSFTLKYVFSWGSQGVNIKYSFYFGERGEVDDNRKAAWNVSLLPKGEFWCNWYFQQFMMDTSWKTSGKHLI